MSHTDDFVFLYLLTLNFLSWPFRHLQCDKSLEQEFIRLGQMQYATDHNPEFQEFKKSNRELVRSSYTNVWVQLNLPDFNGLFQLPIVKKELLEKYGNMIPEKFSPRTLPFPNLSKHTYFPLVVYFFLDDFWGYYHGVFYFQHEKSKIVIPYCVRTNSDIFPHSYISENTTHYSFWHHNLPRIFFNSNCIFEIRTQVVILTDDIACAEFYQTQLLRSGNFDLAWLSWYGDLKLYPWQQLKDKQVYFFMEPHSGLSYAQMLETASEVQEQLRAVRGPKLSLIFMNSNEFLGAWASPYRENIPMIINLEEWKNWTANLRIQGSDPFDYFKHKVTPRPNLPVLLNLTPFAHFIVHGNRILVTGSGNRKEMFLLALLTPFCSDTLMPASPKGTVLFVRHDQSYFHDWVATLQSNHGLNVSDLNQCQLSNNISGPYPLLLDMPLNISTLDPKSTADCQHLLYLIELSTYNLTAARPKILVLDSLSQFLVNALPQTQYFLDALYQNGWTVILVESRRSRYFKVFHCDQEIVVEPSAVCTGNEVVCSTETLIHGKIKKFYSINLVDGNQPILKESSYNRKSAGLLRPRWQLEKELKRLWREGAKGKEIAERLQISESMVKKLKREYGLSKPRSRPDLNLSGNNYYGSNFMPLKPK